MRKRTQRRQKAVLPLKISVTVEGKTHLAHTLDISASGARIVLAAKLSPGTSIGIDFRRRRATGTVVWCKPMSGSKYDHELGIHLPNADPSFWGVNLPMQEPDCPEELAAIPFKEFMNSLSKQA